MRKIGLLLLPFLCVLLVSCSSKATKKSENPGDLYVQGVNLLNKKKYNDAIEKFMKIRGDFPFDPITSVAEVKLGDAYFEKKEYLLAAGVYEDFFNAHPEDENVPYVLRRLGESYTELSPTIDRDQAYTVKAIERFTYFKNRYPQNTHIKQVQARIDELTEKQAAHELYVAEYYYRTEKYNAAILRLDYFLNRYPKAKNRDKAFFLLADSYTRLSDTVRSELYLERLKKEYPRSIYATSTVRRAASKVSTGPETGKTAIVQEEKTPSLAIADASRTKRKEIDLRPPTVNQGKATVSTSPPPAPGINPPSKPLMPAAEVTSSTVSETQTGHTATPAKQLDTLVTPDETPKSSAKKDDQKKGPLGFFSSEKKPIDVVSDTMEGLEKGKVIVFKGNVVAKQGDLVMFSDTLTAYLGEETNEIDKALAQGHVKITKDDRIATCEDALFENTKGEITLKGNVVVFSGPNKVAGDTVRYYINEDRVSVESEKGKRAHITVHPKQ